MRNIFFVNTRYQLEVALDVIDSESVTDCVFLGPSELSGVMESLLPDEVNRIFVDGVNEKFGFLGARKILKEMKGKLERISTEQFDLWLANDDHVLGQFILNFLHIRHVYLFEDGMGSYIEHKPMMLDHGLRGFLSKVKKIAYFAPYYRSFFRFGEGVKAKRCYSYNLPCFPSQDPRYSVQITRRLRNGLLLNRSFPENSVLIVGQPLVEMGMVSKDDYHYLLMRAMERYVDHSYFIYKPHPREVNLSDLPAGISLVLDTEISAEEEIMSCEKKLSVCGFFSTVLLNCAASVNVNDVVAIKSTSVRAPADVYEVLRSVGCEIVDV